MNPNEVSLASVFREHSGELLIIGIILLVLLTLLISLPQLLRANLRKTEMRHAERMKAIEKGVAQPQEDEKGRLAARIATLVPMVVMISAATVTSFLVVYKSESVFAVSLGIWVVAGVVSLAAVTGGVALMGRLAAFSPEDEEEKIDDEAHDSSYMN